MQPPAVFHACSRLVGTPLIAISFMLIQPAALADDTITEVVVTADYRGVSLDDFAASATILDAADIAGRNANHIGELIAAVPNMNASYGSSRARFFHLRGIGERGQFAEPLNSSVGVILDDVDLSGIGTALTTFDIEQVEVLRGPQGTRYGANALAGLIHVVSARPTEEQFVRFEAEAGNYGALGFSGVVSGPMADTVRGRLAIQQYGDDGWYDNEFSGDDTNERDELTVRGRLDLDLDDHVRLGLTAALVDIDNGYDTFSLDNDRDVLSDEPGFDNQESRLLSGKLSIDGRGGVDTEVILGWAESDIEYGYDEDWTFTGFHPFGYTSTDSYLRDRKTLTAEGRIMSNEAGRLLEGRMDWLLGIYRLGQDVDLSRIYTFLPGPFDSTYEIDRTAVFGQADITIGERWSLSGGLRVEWFESGYDDSEGVSFSPDETLAGGQVALSYAVSDDVSVYGQVARGFKAGGFNTDGTLDADLREYDSESLWNVEGGITGTFAGGRIDARIAVFSMWRDDVQIASSVVRVRPDGSAEFIDFTGNAAEGRNTGAEIEWTATLTDAVRLRGSLGLLATEYEDFVNSAGDDLDGRDQAHAPEYQFQLAADVSFTPGLTGTLAVEGRDGYFFSDSHNERTDSVELVNATLAWSNGGFDVVLWGRNLTDEDYDVRGFFFGNDPRDGYTARPFTQLGEPRRFGVTVAWETR